MNSYHHHHQDPSAAALNAAASSTGSVVAGTNVMHLLQDMENFIADFDAKEDMKSLEEQQQQQQGPYNTVGNSSRGLKRKVSEREDSSISIENEQQEVPPGNAITAFLQNQLDGRPVAADSSDHHHHPTPKQHRRRRSSEAVLLKSMESANSPLVTEIESMASASAVPSSDPTSTSNCEPLPFHPQDEYQQQQQQQQQAPQTSAAGTPLPPPTTTHTSAAAAAPGSAFDHMGDAKTYLHRVCRHFSSQKDVVEIALALDPEAVRRKGTGSSAPVQKKKQQQQRALSGTTTSKSLVANLFTQNRVIQERYAYPINIAIQNKASMEVLELLVNQGTDVLLEKDGYERTGSLSIALCHKPRDLDLIDLVLFANLQGILVTDRKLNYPLHMACAKGASVNVIKRLYTHYPAALFQQNFNSETPLDIARRSSLTDEAVLNFLQEQFNQGCLKVARNRGGSGPSTTTAVPDTTTT